MFQALALLAFTLSIQTASPSSAPSPAGPPGHALPANIGSYFSGEWEGAGQFIRSGKPLQSKFVFSNALDGQAVLVRHEEMAPNSFAYHGIISIDSLTGQLVLLLASNKNSGARLFRSNGWQGNTLVFQSAAELHTWFSHERISFARESETSFTATYEMSKDNGVTWSGGDRQQFKKL